jgi:hypothetical protein
MPEFETYVQGGANFPVNGRKTKAALKKAVMGNPATVYLYDTSAFGSKFSGPPTNLPMGMCFNVVGPDPYSARDWYASVYKGAKGALVVK